MKGIFKVIYYKLFILQIDIMTYNKELPKLTVNQWNSSTRNPSDSGLKSVLVLSYRFVLIKKQIIKKNKERMWKAGSEKCAGIESFWFMKK